MRHRPKTYINDKPTPSSCNKKYTRKHFSGIDVIIHRRSNLKNDINEYYSNLDDDLKKSFTEVLKMMEEDTVHDKEDSNEQSSQR